MPLAVVGLLPVVVVLVTSFIPSTTFITKRDCVARDAAGACSKRGPAEAVQFAVVPADASPAGSRLSVAGLKEYDDSNHILFVTVREPELQLFEYFLTKGNPGNSGFDSYEDRFGNVTPDQDRQIAFEDMRNAKNDAYFAALSKLGYPVTIENGPAIVEQLSCLTVDDTGKCAKRTSAAEVLQPNDQITAIDETPVTLLPDLTPAIAAHKAGDTVTVHFKRDGKAMDGQVTLIAAGDDGRPLIGIRMADSRVVTIPNNIKINFDTVDIGGPSAGLSFTLTLIDRLSPGDLTGGKRVAVTGTIDVDGKVGAIGGLQSKATAVRDAGAKYFIVPFNQGPADLAAAQRAAGPGVTLIPVKTLDEALAALQQIGGAPYVQPKEATGSTATPTTTTPAATPAPASTPTSTPATAPAATPTTGATTTTLG
ncbi:MAG: PDZ domain-containing protein [Ilumatobacteraceae bacterium]